MNSIQADVIILGGGIAALWTAHRLRSRGYSCLLLCKGELGAGQTLAAQGVIHGGLKYALGGKVTASSEALAAMPGRWAASLKGEGEIDLRGVEVLSDAQWLWSLPQVMSQVVAFFGGQALKNRARSLPRHQYPPPFDHADYRGKVFRIEEMVVDPVSLVQVLADSLEDGVGSYHDAQWETGDDGVQAVTLPSDVGEPVTLQARRWVFAAGAGNEHLLEQIGRRSPAMQRRPLHQVVLRSSSLPPLYSVCIGTGPKPPVVTTTHRDSSGATLWYVGGDLAEAGVDRSEAEQIEAAQEKFKELMPWMDWAEVSWSTLRVDRAEPHTGTGDRPAGAFCRTEGNVTTVWPTKLALAPDLADQVLASLEAENLLPEGVASSALPLKRPRVARAPWDPSMAP